EEGEPFVLSPGASYRTDGERFSVGWAIEDEEGNTVWRANNDRGELLVDGLSSGNYMVDSGKGLTALRVGEAHVLFEDAIVAYPFDDGSFYRVRLAGDGSLLLERSEPGTPIRI